MKKLLAYFNNLDKESREKFLSDVGMTEGYLRKACSIGSVFNPERCKKIEKATNGAVSRYSLHPRATNIWG